MEVCAVCDAFPKKTYVLSRRAHDLKRLIELEILAHRLRALLEFANGQIASRWESKISQGWWQLGRPPGSVKSHKKTAAQPAGRMKPEI
jgi:hypothetical protein